MRVYSVVSYRFTVLIWQIKEHSGHEVVNVDGHFRVGLFFRVTVNPALISECYFLFILYTFFVYANSWKFLLDGTKIYFLAIHRALDYFI